MDFIAGKNERKPASRELYSVKSTGDHSILCTNAMHWTLIARGVQVAEVYATSQSN